MPSPQPRRDHKPHVSQTSTPILLNEVFTRLRAFGDGLTHACGSDGVKALFVWMKSYGARLGSMADVLQDEGAKRRGHFANAAKSLYVEKTCASPSALLNEVEAIQARLLTTYEQLSMRLDMDEELYNILLEQEAELKEVMEDVRELRLEYEAYGAVLS